MAFSILIVDDEEEICLSLSRLIRGKGYHCDFCTDPGMVIEKIRKKSPDMILMDIRMPKLSGIDLLKIIRKSHPSLPVAVISGHASIDDAVEAMRYGVLDVFTKPLKLPRLLEEIEKVAATAGPRKSDHSENRIISDDAKMKTVLRLAEKAAPTNASVIIMGESGTGKELLANHIFEMSDRSSKSFIKINCAAIPETLIESELFGHEKGAFTDARRRHVGMFEQASGGTIFLDEIGDMHLSAQAKMLRILQEGAFTRVGGSQVIHTDCRVIAATNKDLFTEIRSGRFREDLFYRLSVISLRIPPLRERKCDIRPLAEYFIGHFNDIYGRDIEGFMPVVESFMNEYQWPGNIRELKNFVERAAIFTDGNLIAEDSISERYTSQMHESVQVLSSADDYHEKARQIIIDALNACEGRRTDAARYLNISRKTLYNRMKKLGIE